MDHTEFWNIIETTTARTPADPEMGAKSLSHVLRSLEPASLIAFQRHFEENMANAHRGEVLAAAYAMLGPAMQSSDDGWDIFRAWLVSLGQSRYEKALTQPDSLVAINLESPDVILDAELIWTVASEVWEDTSKQPAEFPVDWYEREEGEILGAMWTKPGEWRGLVPRLTARYQSLY